MTTPIPATARPVPDSTTWTPAMMSQTAWPRIACARWAGTNKRSTSAGDSTDPRNLPRAISPFVSLLRQRTSQVPRRRSSAIETPPSIMARSRMR